MSSCQKLDKELCKEPYCIWVDKKRKYCRTKSNKIRNQQTKKKKIEKNHINFKNGLEPILKYNGGVYANYINKTNSIKLISNSKENRLLTLGRIIGSGSYNTIYDLNNGNVLSISIYESKGFTKKMGLH